MTEIEETLKRIKKQTNVGFVITDRSSKIVRTSFTNEMSSKGELLRNFMPVLAKKAEDLVEDLDPTNKMTFLRIKTRGCEYMVAPDSEHYLTVVQLDENAQKPNDKR